MRVYRHPQIDYDFHIKDISGFEIEIEGIRVHQKDCDWMVMMANHGSSKETITLKDLSLPFLQTILGILNKDKDEKDS
jgi:hypothetical protein